MNALSKKALELENLIEKSLVDKNGLIMSAVDIETMKPFPIGYFAGKTIHNYPNHNWTDFSEFLSYENVGMCSGAYLAAQIWKYKATKNPEALNKAHRTFKGIKWLFDVSQSSGEGFYCKCYGGKPSEQLSSDQYIYTFAGFDQFLEFADAETGKQCVDMCESMVRWWIRKNYSYPYFGRELNWPIERFPAFSWLAWKYTGKREFLDEFNRLLNLDDVRNKIPFGRSWKEITDVLETREPYFDFERKSALRTFSFMPENSESGFLSLEPMLKYGAPEQKLWLNKTKEMFERDKQALFEEGSVNTKMLYDRKTGKITSVKNVINFPENSAAWLSKVYGFVGEVKSAMQSIMFARAATGMYEYLEDVEMLKISAKILKEAKLRELYWRNSEQYPEDLQWMNKVFSGDAATHWLWAYWEGATKYGIDWITEYTEDKKSANIKATIMS